MSLSIKFFFLFVLGCSCIYAEAKPEERKITAMDENLTPNVYVSEARFLFKGFIIPILKQDKAFVVFDLEINVNKESPQKQQEKEIPIIIDTLIADLTPTLETFWDGKLQGLEHSLNKRIMRILKNQNGWVDDVIVSNLRLQESR